MGAISTVVGGTALVMMIPVAPMVIYGIEMKHKSDNRVLVELTELSLKDQTSGMLGIDQNKNGIRDNVEAYIEENIVAPDVNAFAKKYINKLQLSHELKAVPEQQRVQLLQDLQRIESCTPYIKDYLYKNMDYDPSKYIYKKSIRYDLKFATALSLSELIDLMKHSDLVFINTAERTEIKKSSDALAAKNYKFSNTLKGYRGTEAKTNFCMSVYGNDFGM